MRRSIPRVCGCTERTAWATGELTKCIHASVNMGLDVIPVLSGGFAWHTVYPWPQRPDGIIEEAFKELTARWLPLLDLARDNGQVFAYELHPGSDIYDGATYEMFLDYTDNHPRLVSTTIRAIFSSNNSTISTSSDFTANASRDFTLRMLNSVRQVGSGYTAVISHGLDVRGDFVPSATDKWISHKCSPCSLKRVTTVGQYWNGNAVLRVQNKGRQRGHHLSLSILSKRPMLPLMTSQAERPTRHGIGISSA